MKVIRKYAGTFFICLNLGVFFYFLIIFNSFYRRPLQKNYLVYSDMLHFLKEHNIQVVLYFFIIPFISGLILISNSREKLYACAISIIGLLIYSSIPFT